AGRSQSRMALKLSRAAKSLPVSDIALELVDSLKVLDPDGRLEKPTSVGCLCELCVPKNWRFELEDVTDILSEGCRLDPFSPRHVRHFGESKLLDFVGELLAFGLIARAHPVGDKLVELRNFWPAEPGVRACARHAEVDGGIDDVRRLPPRMKQ